MHVTTPTTGVRYPISASVLQPILLMVIIDIGMWPTIQNISRHSKTIRFLVSKKSYPLMTNSMSVS